MRGTFQKDLRDHRATIITLNPYTVMSGTTPRSYDDYVRRGKRLHAQAVRESLRTLWRSAAALTERLAAAHRRRREIRHAERMLRALSPRMLQDIGISTAQIPAVARGLGDDSTLATHQRQRPVEPLSPQPDCLPGDPCFDKAA